MGNSILNNKKKKEIKLKENSLAYNQEVIPIILPTTKLWKEKKFLTAIKFLETIKMNK